MKSQLVGKEVIVIVSFAKLKKLVRKECACFCNKINDKESFCILADDTCYFFDSDDTSNCCYFEKSVLPLDSILEQEYYSYFETEAKIASLNNKPKSKRKCDRCQKPIQASGRQKYCDNCKKEVRREQTRNAMSKRRKTG